MTRVIFPTSRILREWNDIDPLLYQIFMELVERAWPESSIDCRLTCIHRTDEEERLAGGKTGIHTVGPPFRAIDIGGRDFSQAQLDSTASWLNQRWTYDPTQPSLNVAFVRPHGTGPHIHLQVSPRTHIKA